MISGGGIISKDMNKKRMNSEEIDKGASNSGSVSRTNLNSQN